MKGAGPSKRPPDIMKADQPEPRQGFLPKASQLGLNRKWQKTRSNVQSARPIRVLCAPWSRKTPGRGIRVPDFALGDCTFDRVFGHLRLGPDAPSRFGPDSSERPAGTMEANRPEPWQGWFAAGSDIIITSWQMERQPAASARFRFDAQLERFGKSQRTGRIEPLAEAAHAPDEAADAHALVASKGAARPAASRARPGTPSSCLGRGTGRRCARF